MGRQAASIIHGMGEQLPLDTLTRFVAAVLAPDDEDTTRTRAAGATQRGVE